MVVRLLNAAVMPKSGVYTAKELSVDEFVSFLKEAHESKTLESYVGYEATAQLLQSIAGVPIGVNRSSTPVEDGDVLLVARLKYRVTNPADKGRLQPTLEDYEFFKISYRAE